MPGWRGQRSDLVVVRASCSRRSDLSPPLLLPVPLLTSSLQPSARSRLASPSPLMSLRARLQGLVLGSGTAVLCMATLSRDVWDASSRLGDSMQSRGLVQPRPVAVAAPVQLRVVEQPDWRSESSAAHRLPDATRRTTRQDPFAESSLAVPAASAASQHSKRRGESNLSIAVAHRLFVCLCCCQCGDESGRHSHVERACARMAQSIVQENLPMNEAASQLPSSRLFAPRSSLVALCPSSPPRALIVSPRSYCSVR